MKKLLTILLTFALLTCALFSLTACKGEEDPVEGTYKFVSEVTTTTMLGNLKNEVYVGEYYPSTDIIVTGDYLVLEINEDGKCTLTKTEVRYPFATTVQNGTWTSSGEYVNCVILNSVLNSNNHIFKKEGKKLTMTLDFDTYKTVYVLEKE